MQLNNDLVWIYSELRNVRFNLQGDKMAVVIRLQKILNPRDLSNARTFHTNKLKPTLSAAYNSTERERLSASRHIKPARSSSRCGPDSALVFTVRPVREREVGPKQVDRSTWRILIGGDGTYNCHIRGREAPARPLFAAKIDARHPRPS